MDNTTYYQRNRDVALNKAKEYYKIIMKEKSKQEINIETYLKRIRMKKREYGKNRYHNMSEEKKQKLKEYQRKYRKAKK